MLGKIAPDFFAFEFVCRKRQLWCTYVLNSNCTSIDLIEVTQICHVVKFYTSCGLIFGHQDIYKGDMTPCSQLVTG